MILTSRKIYIKIHIVGFYSVFDALLINNFNVTDVTINLPNVTDVTINKKILTEKKYGGSSH